ncbi:fibronectin type III domain-containing protein [Edaphobacter bradus]|uniref:fibronectin type III domain-containing protein n=1 Tax=Edaphobacter bradus TaxID=2259016 RepID=UPI0021E0D875|nr:fibronectin type III domain-containing protein [Edaphobacter bradus]
MAIGPATLLLPFLAACASPGPPRPPSLNLARTVTDLAAERVGDEVNLRWTTPSNTTDGLGVKGPLTAQICRETAPTRPHPICTPVTRLHVKPGPSQATDALPAALTSDPETLIAYQVQIFNANDRAAGPSHPAYAAAGAAPAPVEGLRAEPSREGATIEWQPQPASASWVELERTLPPAFSKTGTPAKPAAPKSPLRLSPDEPASLRLQTPKDVSDRGGTLDRTARKTETYSYRAQRVRSVTFEGHTVELRSAPSGAVTVRIADTFPPQQPAGLAAVPGEAAGSIDLSWQPLPDTDLAGYLVYRRAAAGWQKLTASPVVGPAFTDSTATGGQAYTYRVTAIDTTGNESQPSHEVEETANQE